MTGRPGQTRPPSWSSGSRDRTATTRTGHQQGPPIRYQLLNRPMLDDRQETWSARQFTETPWMTYALRLLQAGVPVELHQWPGTVHSSQTILSAEVSQRQNAELGAAQRRALAG